MIPSVHVYPDAKSMEAYPKPEWAEYQIRMENNSVWDVCEHGIEHPNKAWFKEHHITRRAHACCGCCRVKNS